MPMVEDLSQFLAVTEFAHQAVLDNVEVSGIFDNTPTTADTMTAQVPTYLMASSACARVVYGSREAGGFIEIEIPAGYDPFELAGRISARLEGKQWDGQAYLAGVEREQKARERAERQAACGFSPGPFTR